MHPMPRQRSIPSRLARSALPMLLALLLPLAAGADGDGPLLPDACDTACAAPYGEVLGNTAGGVPAYSNCSADCLVLEANHQAGHFTGLRWQCVEFARRWLLQRRGAVFASIDVAADLWHIDHLERIDGGRIPLRRHLNGSPQAPRVGDLLIYGREFLGTGHVAVVLAIDDAAGTVRVGEQNYLNLPWPGDHARVIPMHLHAGGHWLLDPHLVGWLHPATDEAR